MGLLGIASFYNFIVNNEDKGVLPEEANKEEAPAEEAQAQTAAADPAAAPEETPPPEKATRSGYRRQS